MNFFVENLNILLAIAFVSSASFVLMFFLSQKLR